MKEIIPSEDIEQIQVVAFLESCGLLFCAPPMNMWTTSWSQKARAHRLGARPGLPDLIIVVLPEQARDGKGWLLFLEMKRRKRYTVSPEQRHWIGSINALGCDQIDAVVAHGSDEAIDYLKTYLRDDLSPF